jgi:ribonuclease Z
MRANASGNIVPQITSLYTALREKNRSQGGTVPARRFDSRMSLSVRFLGTSASRPTVERNVSAIALVREGETFLFDCGEGTQRQMMRYGITFALEDIFLTHLHADHILGVVGLVRTMALQGRVEPLRLWGPRTAIRIMRKAEQLGADRSTFPLEITELSHGDCVRRRDYQIGAFDADHGGAPALGFVLVEDERKGRFNPDLARALGIPEGPLWGQLHRGEPVALPGGRVVESALVVGPSRPGRKIVISGDTRPAAATVEAARSADLLVHEATFGDAESERAAETGHSTAREAAHVAREADVRKLALTHFSARYSRDARDLEREAREVFSEVVIARDGMELDVPFVNADPSQSG